MLSPDAQRELIAHYVLDDYTDWPVYMSRLWRNSKVWVDHVAWSIINVILLFFLWTTAMLQWLDRPIRRASQWLYSRNKRPCVGPRQSDKHGDNDETIHALSAVNAETPDIHHAYLADDNATSKVAGTNLAKREFDLDNALLFIHLCALVYEDEVVLEYVLRQWHLEYRVILSPDKECISQAWVIFHSSSTCAKRGHQHCPRAGHDFIIVVFKGTSPFNFTEWMTDLTMSKIKPHGENLPGMVHEGFYEQFQWPIYLKSIKNEEHEDEVNYDEEAEEEEEKDHQDHPPSDSEDDHHQASDPLEATHGFVCSRKQFYKRLGRDGEAHVDERSFKPALTFYELVIRRLNAVLQLHFAGHEEEPAIWISGHSLGAALASIFFAHLLHVPDFPLVVSKKALKGGYAFGTPRTGDARHAKEIGRHPKAKHFYRVINANDIVCTVPLCGHAKTQDPRALTNFSHIGTPVLLNYWGTFEVGVSWNWSHAVRNALLHYAQLLLPVPFVIHVLRSRAKLLTLARVWNLHLCCFLVDHFPSGYIKHLHACKARQNGQV